MSTTLTAPEVRRFAKLESAIEAGLQSFVATGNALAAIRDDLLYRATHATFDAYCRDRWGIAKSRAYQLIAAASTAEEMSTTVDVSPTNERQVRPLTKLPEAERASAWQEAVAAEPEGPTAETVEAVVVSRLQDEPEQDEPAAFKCDVCGGESLDVDENGWFCAACKDPTDEPEFAKKPADETSAPKPEPPAKSNDTRRRFKTLWNFCDHDERILVRAFANDWPLDGDVD